MINRVFISGFLVTSPIFSTGKDGKPVAVFQLYHRKPRPTEPPERRYVIPCVVTDQRVLELFKAVCKRGDMLCAEGSLVCRDTPCKRCHDPRLEMILLVRTVWNMNRFLNPRYGHTSEEKLAEYADEVLSARSTADFLDFF